MSAVLESLPVSPVAAARERLDAAQADLAALDARIRTYQREGEEIEMQRHAHRTATIVAVGAGKPVPKPPKQKQSDAETALPILRAKRKELTERVVECEGRLRGACVEDVERRYGVAQATFAQASAILIDAWRDLVGVKTLLDGSGFKGEPLPPSLTHNFFIPAMGPRLRPIIENHWAHFVASHSMQQGEGSRVLHAARAEIEREIGMKLPW